MSESIGETDIEQIKARRGALIKKYSPQIWEFIFNDARHTYFLHEDDLVADAPDGTRQLIKSREITLDRDEASVIDHYSYMAKDNISERFITDPQLQKLIDLEGVYAKNTLTLSQSEPTLRLGTISMGTTSQQEATILIPQKFEDFLNLRNAAATLERAVGEVTQEPYSMILKVPGLLAVSVIAESLEGPQADTTPTGLYL